jgi:predicted nucleic acid-binding protein
MLEETMPLHLFVDTNVWLSFFAFSNDDITQLGKLIDLINNGTLKLYVPEQVANEFMRNREVKLADSIKEFSKGFSKALPRFLMDFEEAKAFKKAFDELDKAKNDLIQKANEGAVSRTFAVDTLVANVFSAATIGDVTSEMVEKARLRRDIGNPPGKNGSLGDQINWEYLLEKVPQKAILHVVSKDGDYQSAMKNGHPHHYLSKEWSDVKKGELCLHQELKPFLNTHFEIMKLEVDKEKIAVIKSLVESGTFATTHRAIAQLDAYFDAITADDANLLLEKGLSNSQISWISTDSDVKSFYSKLLDKFSGQFKGELEEQGLQTFKPQPEKDEEIDEDEAGQPES